MSEQKTLEERIAALEKEQNRPKDRYDIAKAIVDWIKDSDEVKLFDYEGDHRGPQGGTSCQITLQLVGREGRDVKYVTMNIYDDERIQKLGERKARQFLRGAEVGEVISVKLGQRPLEDRHRYRQDELDELASRGMLP